MSPSKSCWDRGECTPVLRSTGLRNSFEKIEVTRDSTPVLDTVKGRVTYMLVCVRHSTIEFNYGGVSDTQILASVGFASSTRC